MGYVINKQDPRDMRALRILHGARKWIKCHVTLSYGYHVKAYGIPSESEPGVYRLTNLQQCSCPDFQYRQADELRKIRYKCAHQRAVRLYVDYQNEQRRLNDLRESAARAGARRVAPDRGLDT